MSRHVHPVPLPRWTVHAHRRDSRGVAFTPDGIRLVTIGDDQPVRVWRTDTGEPVCAFDGHRRGGEAVATHRDNQHIVTGGRDKMVRIWDWIGEREVRALAGHTGAVTAVAVSPDGVYIASGSTDRSIRMWEFATGVEVGCWSKAVTDPVRFIGIVDLDGYPWVFASAEDGGTVHGQFAAPKPARKVGNARILAMDPARSNLLVVDRGDGLGGAPQAALRVFGPDGLGPIEGRLGDHIGSVRCGAFTTDGAVLTGSSDRGVRCFRINGRLTGHLRGPGAAVDRMAWSCDGVLAVGDSDGRVLVYPPGTFEETQLGPPHVHGISAIGHDHDGQIFSIGRDGRLVTYDHALKPSEPQELRPVRSMHTSGGFLGGAWAHTGPYTLSSAPAHGLERWELHGQPMPQARATGADGSAVAMSASKSIVAAIYLDRTCRLYDPETLEARVVIPLRAYPEALAVHPSGDRLAIADEKGDVLIANNAGGVLRRMQTTRITALAWRGAHLLAGMANGNLCLIKPNGVMRQAKGHVGKGVWAHVRTIAVMGNHAVTSGRDRALVLWRLDPIEAIERIELPAEVADLAVEGRTVVYGDMAGVVGRWAPF